MEVMPPKWFVICSLGYWVRYIYELSFVEILADLGPEPIGGGQRFTKKFVTCI